MPNIDRLKRIDAAEKAFVRAQQKTDASVATAEYHAAQQALHERTRKLREQRLIHEASAARNK